MTTQHDDKQPLARAVILEKKPRYIGFNRMPVENRDRDYVASLRAESRYPLFNRPWVDLRT